MVLEKILESPLDCKEIQPVHPKGDQSWVFIGRTDARSWNSNTLATWCEELTHLKRPWCWERLRAGGEGDDRGWDGWMASSTQWTWVWVDSGNWWWTGRPGTLWFMGSQRVRNNWAAELNWNNKRSLEGKLGINEVSMCVCAHSAAHADRLLCLPTEWLLQKDKENARKWFSNPWLSHFF